MAAVEKQLFEVKEIMRQNLDDLLNRGETLDTLMQRSKDISTVSYNIYNTAK